MAKFVAHRRACVSASTGPFGVVINSSMTFPRPRGLAGLTLAAVTFVGACGPLPDDDVPPATPASVAPPPPDQQVQVDPNADVYADTDPSAVTDFHPALDPHGTWVEDPAYGTVWMPNAAEVGPDFAPYRTAGHWAYDDDDYVWYSDYDWGWATFHYGRWMYGGAGWMWIPGRVYSPAWVTWRMGGPGYGYVGWAPMAPTFYWRGGVAMYAAPVVIAPGGFYYAAHGDIFARSIGDRVIGRGQAVEIAAHTQAYGAAGHAGGRGPAPGALGIAPGAVAHGTPGDRGNQMARNFARPSTAKTMGAHPPTQHRVVAAPHARSAGGGGGSRGAAHGGGGGGGHHR